MTYLTWINKLRVELKDFPKLRRDKFDGDASTTLFELSTTPIKDGSYVVKIGGVTQVEVTNYTIDKDTGVIEFTSAPASGSDNIVVTYKSVKIRDEDYLEIINDAIDHFRWKFWDEAIDDDTFTTVKDQYEYDLSSLSDILYVIRSYYKGSTGAAYWQETQVLTNYKYYVNMQKLFVDPPFSISSLPMKFTYLKSFAKGSTTSATLAIPDQWLLPYKFYVYARYYERLIPEKIHDTSAITAQPSFTPAQSIYNISQAFYGRAEDVANKLAPKLPPMPIKQLHAGSVL